MSLLQTTERLTNTPSEREIAEQMRELESTLGPISDAEGAVDRRRSQAIGILTRKIEDRIRVESIGGMSVVFGKSR